RCHHPHLHSFPTRRSSDLVEKGHVAFRQDGPRYLYRATLAKSAAEGNAWRRLLDTFFSGSTADAVVSLLGREGGRLSAEELDAIERKVAELRSGRPAPGPGEDKR